jgi:hypothetical protein
VFVATSGVAPAVTVNGGTYLFVGANGVPSVTAPSEPKRSDTAVPAVADDIVMVMVCSNIVSLVAPSTIVGLPPPGLLIWNEWMTAVRTSAVTDATVL